VELDKDRKRAGTTRLRRVDTELERGCVQRAGGGEQAVQSIVVTSLLPIEIEHNSASQTRDAQVAPLAQQCFTG
jgi:hypothetical protein